MKGDSQYQKCKEALIVIKQGAVMLLLFFLCTMVAGCGQTQSEQPSDSLQKMLDLDEETGVEQSKSGNKETNASQPEQNQKSHLHQKSQQPSSQNQKVSGHQNKHEKMIVHLTINMPHLAMIHKKSTHHNQVINKKKVRKQNNKTTRHIKRRRIILLTITIMENKIVKNKMIKSQMINVMTLRHLITSKLFLIRQIY